MAKQVTTAKAVRDKGVKQRDIKEKGVKGKDAEQKTAEQKDIRQREVRAKARPGRPGYDQAEVLRRAVDLFNARGYDATSIGDLARDLGVTKSAIYHHVASKDDLLAAALDEAVAALGVAIDRALAAAPDDNAYHRLRHVVTESVQIVVAHRPAVTLLLRVRGNSELEQRALAHRRAIDERLTGLVRDAVAEGSVRADIAPDVITRLIFGTVNSVVEWYRPDGPLDADTLARTVAAMGFDGLSSPVSRSA